MPTPFTGTRLRHWLRPPKHLLTLFLGTTLSVLVALVWLGWHSLKQDRDVETQRVRYRLESTTDAIAADMRQNLAAIEAQLEGFALLPPDRLQPALAAYALRFGPDALIVAFDAGSVQAFPKQRLLYYPTLPAAEEPYVHPLLSGPAEPPPADPRVAMDLFDALAQSDDGRVRAEALLGVARAQARLGQTEAALATYAELRRPDVLVAGRPAELLARLARCDVLADVGRRAELADAVRELDRDLHSGRWELTRAAYEHYADQIRRLAAPLTLPADEARPAPAAVSLAASIDALWREWQDEQLSPEMAAGRMSRAFGAQPVFLLWRGTSERLVGLAAGPQSLEDLVIGPLRAQLDRQGLQVVLETGEGQTVLARGAPGAEAQRVFRTMAETQLPWNLRVVGAGVPADHEQFARNSQLVIAGLTFLALFVLAGSYFSVRAVSREIQAARLKSDFVAAVSHEFRTPLTLLRQFSDLLAEDRVSSEQERRDYYAALQRGTRRLTRLVEDLLDFGRMEAGSRAFTLQPLVANAWLFRIVREFENEIRSKGYTVDVCWTGPASAVVQADEGAIGRALWNLLDNAVKYSPGCKTIWVAGSVEGDRLVVRVRDRGLGVTTDEQRAIFRKFVRGSASRGQVKGTGLGLALVEQIVEAHGGSVQLDSRAGEGSTFSIILPVAAAVAEPPVQERRTWRAS